MLPRAALTAILLTSFVLALSACRPDEAPPCTPIPGSGVDPCEPGVPWQGGWGASIPHLGGAPLTVREMLDGVVPWVPHLVLRGTYLPGAVRCTSGDRLRLPSYANPEDFGFTLHTLSFRCYADVRAHAYIVGDGPSTVTVQVDWDIYGDGYYASTAAKYDLTEAEWIEELRQSHEQSLIHGHYDYLHYLETGNERLAGGIEGKEVVLFIGPTHDVSTETWEVMETWDVQRQDDGTIVAVHPERDPLRWIRPDDYPTHRAALEMELPALRQAVTTAHQARVAEYGGRIGATANLPKLVTNVNQLNQFFRDTGAYDHPGGLPAQPPAVPVCASGTAVTNPATERGLVYDCSALIAARDALRGTATLNWGVGTAIGSWDGVTTAGTPARVTKVILPNRSLSGSIPAELGRLFQLTHLDLSGNALTGEIPAELGALSELEGVKLTINKFTGCVPPSLRNVSYNDVAALGLPDCGG